MSCLIAFMKPGFCTALPMRTVCGMKGIGIMSGCNFSHPLASALRRRDHEGREREGLDGWCMLNARQGPPMRVLKTDLNPQLQCLTQQQLTRAYIPSSSFSFPFDSLLRRLTRPFSPFFHTASSLLISLFWNFIPSDPSPEMHFSTITSALVFGLMATAPVIAKPVELNALEARAVSHRARTSWPYIC